MATKDGDDKLNTRARTGESRVERKTKQPENKKKKSGSEMGVLSTRGGGNVN